MSRHIQAPPAAPVARLEKQISALADRINALCLDQAASASPKLGITISEAADMLGMSRAQFRRVFLRSGRVRVVPVGERARVVDVAELREAYHRYKEETRGAGLPL